MQHYILGIYMKVLQQLALLFLLFSVAFNSQAEVNENTTINDIHQQMQSKQLTSEQLVQFYLQRIAEFDDKGMTLNSVVQLNKNALKQAKALDRYFLKHRLKGSLHGIPILLKDNIDTTDGMANTAGSVALANNFPDDDAFLVKQLKEAGAIILGKTNFKWIYLSSPAKKNHCNQTFQDKN